MLKRQEAFDKALIGIYAQGGPSLTPMSGSCAMNGSYNRHCAIGHLLPHELNARIDTTSGYSGVRNGIVQQLLPKWIVDDLDFYSDLQCIHDAYHGEENFMDIFLAEMRKFAEKMGLVFNEEYDRASVR